METTLQKKIIKNAIVSLFIYALPVILMFLTFYLKGERPWIKQEAKKVKTLNKY